MTKWKYEVNVYRREVTFICHWKERNLLKNPAPLNVYIYLVFFFQLIKIKWKLPWFSIVVFDLRKKAPIKFKFFLQLNRRSNSLQKRKCHSDGFDRTVLYRMQRICSHTSALRHPSGNRFVGNMSVRLLLFASLLVKIPTHIDALTCTHCMAAQSKHPWTSYWRIVGHNYIHSPVISLWMREQDNRYCFERDAMHLVYADI